MLPSIIKMQYNQFGLHTLHFKKTDLLPLMVYTANYDLLIHTGPESQIQTAYTFSMKKV